MVAQILKAPSSPKLFEKLVRFLQQLGVAFAHADGPGFLLEGLQKGTGRLLIPLPVLENRHLIINEAVYL